MADKKITIKLIKSGIGRIKSHKQCIKGLGFRKLNQVIEVEDTPSVRGMINKIRDMVVEISPEAKNGYIKYFKLKRHFAEQKKSW